MWFWILLVAAGVVYWLWKQRQGGGETSGQRQISESDRQPSISVTCSYNGYPSDMQARGSDVAWLLPGVPKTIAGRTISSGLVYVTRSHGKARTRWRDPSLIDQTLSVASHTGNGLDGEIGYWPSYETLSPTNRAKYLDWLAANRETRDIDPGLLFIFYYGLERRVLDELLPDKEWPEEINTIREEIRRLLSIYSQVGSFAGYAGRLLEFLNCYESHLTGNRLALGSGHEHRGRMPLDLRAGLGQFVGAGEPIPVEWAMAWVHNSQAISLKTPARRCKEEFEKLFPEVYSMKFGDGMKIPENRTRLVVDYLPASAARIYLCPRLALDLPDVGALKRPTDKLQAVVDTVTDKLEEFSRALGRKSAASLGSFTLAYLPSELLSREDAPRGARTLQEFLSERLIAGETQLIRYKEIVQAFDSQAVVETLTRKRSECVSLLLYKLGFGIEPDVRRGARGPSLDELVCVFRLPHCEEKAESSATEAAELLLQMGLLLSAVDGESPEEKVLLERQLELLPLPQQIRMRARLRLQREDPKAFPSMRKKARELSENHKRSIASFLLALAAADGRVTKDEIAALGKLYGSLGLDPESIHADIHSLMASRTPVVSDEGEPVLVRRAAKTSEEFSLPRAATAGGDTVILDPDLVRAKRAETESVVATLSDVFAEEDVQDLELVPTEDENAHDEGLGLDPTHDSLLHQLLSLEQISREQWKELCEEAGVLPDAAIEVINEAALEIFDDVLVVEMDPVAIDPDMGRKCRGVYE